MKALNADEVLSEVVVLFEEEPNRDDNQFPVDAVPEPVLVVPREEFGATTPFPRSIDEVRAEGPGTDSVPLAQRYRLNGPHFKACFSEAEGANGEALSESFEVVPPGFKNEKATFSLLCVPETQRLDPGKAGKPVIAELMVVLAIGGVVLGARNRLRADDDSRRGWT